MIGKIGTDIEDNKCSWLVCTALKIASEEQKEVIKVRQTLAAGLGLGGPVCSLLTGYRAICLCCWVVAALAFS